ncbi:GntR family transcriptional regulator [Polynucleobacter sp.]|uniref:GntR family transcriptional regulator n=1 Tax=Polynucleobacter sp. TaxID=2029855 RepID=UPI0027364165|nr:GntR family transcriptional regulator [Polynucleobacter sp.]MDP3122495.1 GntR family transcriptional regulator [Polynucleobacter sp.]
MPETTAPSATFSPLYQQIKALLLSSLQSGEWRPGAPIPSEMELAARYEVSQGTVRKAVDELATENLLIRHQGKGTFVASHHSEAWQYRFFSLMPDSGKKVPLKSHFLACKPIKSPAKIAQLLKTAASERVIQIDRVQSLGGQVAVFEQIWLPEQRFSGMTLDRLESWPGPLYAFYESEFATHMVRAEEKIKAIAAEATIANHLKLEPGSPLLLVERVSYTYGNKPVEVRRAHYDTRQQHYENKLN